MVKSIRQDNQPSYQELQAQLNEVLASLQQDDIAIDDAVERYEQGLQLIKQLKFYLETTENKITSLQAKHTASS